MRFEKENKKRNYFYLILFYRYKKEKFIVYNFIDNFIALYLRKAIK